MMWVPDELFSEAQGRPIVHHGRDMHIMSALKLHITGKHVGPRTRGYFL